MSFWRSTSSPSQSLYLYRRKVRANFFSEDPRNFTSERIMIFGQPNQREYQVPCKDPDNPGVEYSTWGIFNIAHDKKAPFYFSPSLRELSEHKKQFYSFLRLLVRVWSLDRLSATTYLLSIIWLTFSSALSLYLAFLFLSSVCLLFNSILPSPNEY